MKRSESGNMEKGKERAQQGDTQQELAQTLISLLRSIGSTSSHREEASIDLVVDQFQRMHPPSFAGEEDPMIAENWLEQMNIIFEGISCSDDRKVALAVLVLKDAARLWWSSRHRLRFSSIPMKDISWEDFTKEFEQRYMPLSIKAKTMKELNNLRQEKLSVTVYEIKFSHLAKYVSQLVTPEEQRCYMFRRGLWDEIRAALVAFRTTNYVELLEHAHMVQL
ncbi:hypothetical protein HPP92_012367 [Vanilla planifolia]|uniref:Retrotransposon gag domain-containing protein n=1 Tax=Vanilla planifolia TaxID=51239 RepID=A0A835UZB5_VANPL|nr:hypothetical protein HPP92_012367 [Vanilla planifolia]